LDGFHYGAQAGAIVRVIDKIELETGKDTFSGVTIKANNVHLTEDFPLLGNLYLI
jgi:hypothetical protein